MKHGQTITPLPNRTNQLITVPVYREPTTPTGDTPFVALVDRYIHVEADGERYICYEGGLHRLVSVQHGLRGAYGAETAIVLPNKEEV
jgi:hypothetical protein